MTAKTGPASEPSIEAQRLLQFVKYNEPAGPIGCAIVIGVYWLVPDKLFSLLFLSVALNWVLVIRARRMLHQNRLEAAVLCISTGMWAISLALWITLPITHGLGAIIGLMPIILAAAYIRRQFVLPIMLTSVGIATIGGVHFVYPVLEIEVPRTVAATAVAVFAPALTASCALAVWHSISRLLETLDEMRAANRALAESERLLERKVDKRTADLVRSQRDLAVARDEALAANRAKSTFLANMSHELRTPLNAVIGYSEMIQEDARDAGHDDYIPDLEKIVASGKHLLGLINDVLDLSKIEAGKVELFAETFDVAELINGTAATIKPLLVRNGNRLELSELAGAGTMHSDITRVRQILFNLLSNAAKFTKEGTIRLSASRTNADGGDWLEFAVADTGIGMTQEQLGRVFEAFGQADAETTRDYGGTGLGLTITKLFCEMLGGSIDVTSESGRGTEFRVRLPAQLPEPGEAAVAEAGVAAAPTPAAEGAATVLVIDDEETARDLMRRFLTREGYAVVTAASGEEGLRLARAHRPDVITLDVLMPRMDGWAVLSTLKADPELADIPVVIVTMVNDQNLGYALGASEYMSKPVDRERLATVLRRYASGGATAPILVVEDDSSTRQLLRRTVEKAGFEVAEAENGRVALEQIARATPQLILLDLMMPEMDGFELLAELRERESWRSIPIVVITAKELTPVDRERLDGATVRVLQKGAYDRAALLMEVRRLVRARTAQAPSAKG